MKNVWKTHYEILSTWHEERKRRDPLEFFVRSEGKKKSSLSFS